MRYCKSTIFQANHNSRCFGLAPTLLFAILQKYDFSSKSQHLAGVTLPCSCCLRYCKSTIFQANHNERTIMADVDQVVCDTAKVRFFKQITTEFATNLVEMWLFAILQKYDFSSKSQQQQKKN